MGGKIRRASNGLITISYPILLSWVRSPSQTILLIKCTRRSSGLSLTRVFPASPWNHSDESITVSFRNQRASHPLETTKPAFTAPGCLLYS